jgi:electron transport complex protein RnfC
VLASFKKGVHPQDYKVQTNQKQIKYMPLPDEVFIPLQQHIGAICKPVCEKGQAVKTGQIIGRSERFVSSTIHSSVTGIVKNIDNYLHPLGTKVPMVHIQKTGEDNWEYLPELGDWYNTDITKLLNIIFNAGIVGLGGATFPTHVKLSPPKDKKIDCFILNGCECEPYLTADHRVMVEFTEKLLHGMAIIMRILGTDTGFIGIENNKFDAIEIITKKSAKLYPAFKIIPLKVKYPQGAEKMLIKAITGQNVPAGGLPMDIGIIVHNIGTTVAIAEAVLERKPLIQRVVTISGDGINDANNVMVRLGTSFQTVINFCGGIKKNTNRIFMGGPMMGFVQYDLAVPVIKATSGIICVQDNTNINQKYYTCIKCGNCISACPMNLLPTTLARYTEVSKWAEANNLGILNCIECGACAYVCPSHIPLVQWIRIGKMKVAQLNKKLA